MARVLAIVFLLTIITIFNTVLLASYKQSFYDSLHPRDRFTRCVQYFDSADHNNYTEKICDKFRYRYTLLNLDKSIYVTTYYVANFIGTAIIVVISMM